MAVLYSLPLKVFSPILMTKDLRVRVCLVRVCLSKAVHGAPADIVIRYFSVAAILCKLEDC